MNKRFHERLLYTADARDSLAAHLADRRLVEHSDIAPSGTPNGPLIVTLHTHGISGMTPLSRLPSTESFTVYHACHDLVERPP